MARVRLSWYVGAIHGCTPVCFAVLAAVLVVGFPLYLTCNITSRLDPCLANHRPVRLAYQPPANSTFLSKQTSH
jgi:hypothetical protein